MDEHWQGPTVAVMLRHTKAGDNFDEFSFRVVIDQSSHGELQVKGIQSRISETPVVVRYPRSEPVSMIWSFPHQINLTFGRRAKC